MLRGLELRSRSLALRVERSRQLLCAALSTEQLLPFPALVLGMTGSRTVKREGTCRHW